MKIEWFGQACFRMESISGFRAVTDPFDAEMGYPQPPLFADLVTISHQHHDHNNREWVQGNPVYLDRVGHREIQGVQVQGFPSYHDEVRGEKRGKNLIFTFVIDGVRVCHLGDLGHQLDDLMLRQIGMVDVLMTPVGGYYTIDGPQAWKIVEAMRPKVVIPMHFRTEAAPIEVLTDAQPFLQCAGTTPEVVPAFTVDATTLPSATQVVLLDWRHD